MNEQGMRMDGSKRRLSFGARPLRGLALFVSFGLFLLVLPPSNDIARAAPGRPPALAGRTRVLADSTTGMRVTVPRRATVDARSGTNPDIGLRGAGRITGVILTDDDVTDATRTSLTAVRFGFCGEPGCHAEHASQQYLYTGAADGEKVVVEPGSYLLYVIADGAPVTIDLRLHGLSGSTLLRPRGEVHSGFITPGADNATGSPGDQTFWFGEEFDIQGDAGVLIGMLRMDLANWVNVHWGDCAYDVAPPPRPLAYSPVCPGGFNVFQNEGAVLAQSKFERPLMSEIGAGGRFGYGLYYDAAAEISNAYTAFLHLSLDPDAL